MNAKVQPGDNREEADFDGISDELRAERLEEFRGILFNERQRLMKNARRTLTEEMTVDQDDLPDEMDLASADYNQQFETYDEKLDLAQFVAMNASTVRALMATHDPLSHKHPLRQPVEARLQTLLALSES